MLLLINFGFVQICCQQSLTTLLPTPTPTTVLGWRGYKEKLESGGWEMCYILINLEKETEARGYRLPCGSAFIRLLPLDLSSPAGWKSQAAGNGFADGPFLG